MTILIAGTSGAGKSSVARELAGRGYRTLDTDRDRRLARWTTPDGRVVDWADTRIQDPQWTARHLWTWDAGRVAEILGQGDPPAVWCGMSENLEAFADRFALIVQLALPGPAVIARLTDPARTNPWGKDPSMHAPILDATVRIDARLGALGAVRVDARRPLAEVVGEVAGLIAAHEPGSVPGTQQPTDA